MIKKFNLVTRTISDSTAALCHVTYSPHDRIEMLVFQLRFYCFKCVPSQKKECDAPNCEVDPSLIHREHTSLPSISHFTSFLVIVRVHDDLNWMPLLLLAAKSATWSFYSPSSSSSNKLHNARFPPAELPDFLRQPTCLFGVAEQWKHTKLFSFCAQRSFELSKLSSFGLLVFRDVSWTLVSSLSNFNGVDMTSIETFCN